MNNNIITERIQALRSKMKAYGIDVYMIPTSDFHDSEYVSPHFQVREYFSGFTGSAGVLVVSKNEAALFTDGRYFIQAEKELSGTGIVLMKSGTVGVPKVTEYIKHMLENNEIVGFDGRVVDSELGRKLKKITEEKNGSIKADVDLADEIWLDRPAIAFTPVYELDIAYSGESCTDKLKHVREIMKEKETDTNIITTLDDIAWLFNIRANDIDYCPVVIAYAIVTMEKAVIFANVTSFSDKLIEKFAAINVEIKPYDEFYKAVQAISNCRILLSQRTNYRVINDIKSSCIAVCNQNPSTALKAVKNEIELENIKNAHIKDGIAVTKFMYWLKKTVGTKRLTECDAADILEQFRREQDGFIELSFETISAYKENAAMMHYTAKADCCAELQPEGMLLVDSGGHYYQGSTDITRTYVLGEISEEIKLHYTTAVKSMLNLAAAHFLYGCCGANLDILARGPFWDIGLDYRCGTGHGVGYLLNVHESPNGFRWHIVPERNDCATLEHGMVTTDEPGVYVEGSHGIRIENELVCREAESNEYGQFMKFENITYSPIDLDGIDKKYLSEIDIKRLNDYHAMVFEKLAPFFDGDELEFLREYTRSI